MNTKDYVSRDLAIKLKYHGFDGDNPTLWQAHQWLRKKHNIFIAIELDSYKNFGYDIIDFSNEVEYKCGGGFYKSYEDALHRGIEHALERFDYDD